MAKQQANYRKAADLSPLGSSYNEHLRPQLDTVDRLRQQGVMEEGIELPTIVVVSDQSSGKSSVLESLAGISLPRSQDICTRVPLIMRLQHADPHNPPEMVLEYPGKKVPVSESTVSDAITAATVEVAGDGTDISNTPLTLSVKKSGVPDLTMVDLPGITRVPVKGQPEDIHKQISDLIKHYITPTASIILNVLQASSDFSTCESILMSQSVDKNGKRTLAVVTKVDKQPEGLLEKVMANHVNIGLGYVCVRNRIGNESYEKAREEEAKLFSSHPLLSKLDKSIVGIPALARRLIEIQASSIDKHLPQILEKIINKLNKYDSELNQMPPKPATKADAVRAIMHVANAAKDTLRNVLVHGVFEEFPGESEMHGTARLATMLQEYANELPPVWPQSGNSFLEEEISVLEECKRISLPNFVPPSTFTVLMQRKINAIAEIPVRFVRKAWGYIEGVVGRVLAVHTSYYPQVHAHTRRAVASLCEKMRDRSLARVGELVDMERAAEYTQNPDYSATYTILMATHETFMSTVKELKKPSKVVLNMYGEVDVGHLRGRAAVAEQAFDVRTKLTAYWKSVVLRLVDGVALHLLLSVRDLVEREVEREILDEIVARGGVERMMEEAPSVAAKRKRLMEGKKRLSEAKVVFKDMMDRVDEA